MRKPSSTPEGKFLSCCGAVIVIAVGYAMRRELFVERDPWMLFCFIGALLAVPGLWLWGRPDG